MIKISINETRKCMNIRCTKTALYFITDLHPEKFGSTEGREENYFCSSHFIGFCTSMALSAAKLREEKHGNNN